MNRPVTIKCRVCGCEEVNDELLGPLSPDSRSWRVISGQNNLLRQGGCSYTCICHDSFKRPDVIVTYGSKHDAAMFPVRPEIEGFPRLIDSTPR